MIFDILTLFPAMFASPFRASILGKSLERGLIHIRVHNIRDYATDRHQVTDDRPFGGGEGMVMKPEPIVAALDALRGGAPDPWVVLLTPQGRLFNQEMARSLSRRPRVAVICGRYEGIDERVGRYFADDQVSIGDYVLTGGEFAAMVLVDAVARLLPGVVGKVASVEEDSFAEPLLEHPHYTRPQSFQGHEVPEVLLSGNHEAIRRWRRAQTLLRTRLRRPDLLARVRLSAEDEKLLGQAMEETLRNGGEVPFVPPPGEEPPSSGPGTLPGGEPQG